MLIQLLPLPYVDFVVNVISVVSQMCKHAYTFLLYRISVLLSVASLNL